MKSKRGSARFLGIFDRIFRRQAAACNEHIAKIAALPRVDRKSVFLRSLLALIKCWKAATSAICHYVVRKRETVRRATNEKSERYERKT